MLFQSFSFVLIFLPLVVLGWHFFSAFRYRGVSEWFMILAGICFYSFFGVRDLVLILACTAVGYLLHRAFWRARSGLQTKLFLAGGILLYLAVLLFYKISGGALPVGLSFYLFQLIIFLIERARGKFTDISAREYFFYVLYFPKLAQGPIAFPEEILDQLQTRTRGRIDKEALLRGLILFILGLAKKVLFADALAPLVQHGFEQTLYLDTATVLLVMISYAFQLYFDFSGYCDMAMGISQMLGIRLPVNFNSPFQATNQRDFWKRWHMTLTRFFTRYVYIPLGGSRKGVLRTIVNTLLVFLLSGLWHGLGITYLVWGAINGVFVVVSHFLSKLAGDGGKQPENLKKGGTFGRIRTFAAFLFTLVFFRSESVEMAVAMLKRFLIPLYPGFLLRTAEHLNIVELYPLTKALSLYLPGTESTVQLILWILLLILGFFLIRRKNAYEIAAEMPLKTVYIAPLALLFAWSMLAFNNVGTFLYFAY
ncbi:MAG: MBOAT family protein [Lachnospiraceae bacterium]|nr:MBOAT family protein [Lachnospiraceae bacterium]